MQHNKNILSLTSDLLINGGFSHLKDEKVSALHHVIPRLKGPLNPVQQNLLLNFWNYADAGNLPAALLYRCNTVLLQHGRSPILEVYVEVE